MTSRNILVWNKLTKQTFDLAFILPYIQVRLLCTIKITRSKKSMIDFFGKLMA